MSSNQRVWMYKINNNIVPLIDQIQVNVLLNSMVSLHRQINN